MPTHGSTLRVAAISDIHYGKASAGTMAPLFAQIAEVADILVICGDLTDYGLAEEARVLVADLQAVKIPIVAVLGNHDLESGEEHEVTEVLTRAGVRMLDGDTFEYRGVGFAGIRGFCGGFGRGALGPWGERVIKDFVNEAVQEALKLESAIQKLQTEHKIVLMHYAPVRETVEGEPLEIFAFLGSSRLEEPLTRLGATAVFHGHAHRGAPEGKTTTGIPVYNVSYPVLKASYPDRPPFRMLELEIGVKEPTADGPAWSRRASDRASG
ncbi:MAG TPA: metallophosphoesterase [Gemmatimonadaceae bacterium]|nr:metallophosphoesterase [Gemmatimonadaceae bacterium]